MKMEKSDCGHHQKRKRCNKKGVKVVYISSPMKVKTCASKFRALVQELTGKDSDSTCCFPDPYAFQKSPELPHHHLHRQESSYIGGGSLHDHQHPMMSTESPTFSDATEPIDHDQYGDVFRSHRDDSYFGIFSSNLFSDQPFQLDAFKSFDSIQNFV
ncbi:hypothetical protein LWI28_023400 [Acer negundo]|uniref:VQ domain-containing protein n=1 Tax=Acer negundo TaxID=4023 RepID=A0AAD5IE10_ACENE|nr:hypothetical protein LWI28_023400 [Acer negundo]KAK4835121.1 hypothetical protein QYF36_005526 [Acer negundo]